MDSIKEAQKLEMLDRALDRDPVKVIAGDCGMATTDLRSVLREMMFPPCWGLESWQRTDGYVWVRISGHPRTIPSRDRVSWHVVIAGRAAGRIVRRDEHVHHKNEIRWDNRPENLEVMSSTEHRRMHAIKMHEEMTPAEKERWMEVRRKAAARRGPTGKYYGGGASPTYSREDLVDHLRSLAEDIGRTPRATDINDADGPCAGTYYNRFDSIRAAQRAAGLEPNKRGRTPMEAA